MSRRQNLIHQLDALSVEIGGEKIHARGIAARPLSAATSPSPIKSPELIKTIGIVVVAFHRRPGVSVDLGSGFISATILERGTATGMMMTMIKPFEGATG
ncbi:MAG: hypothetical protein WAV78_16360 [Xanthobacteraceae bacterium]